MATTGSPKTSPHCGKPDFDVRITAPLHIGAEEFEGQIAGTVDDEQIAYLVDDQQAPFAEEANTLRELSLSFATGKRADKVGKRREVDAPFSFTPGAVPRRFLPIRGGRGNARPASIDKAEPCQGEYSIAVK